jgi:hypothetical protein
MAIEIRKEVALMLEMPIRDLQEQICFLAKAYSEPVLIRIAYAFEQATRARGAPTFRPTLDMAGGIDAERAK